VRRKKKRGGKKSLEILDYLKREGEKKRRKKKDKLCPLLVINHDQFVKGKREKSWGKGKKKEGRCF